MVAKGLGYTQSQADHTLFYKYSAVNKTAILIVYVDDIILTGDDSLELKDLKEKLAKAFGIKELGSLKYFPGIEFARYKEGIFMNQRKYILDILKETRLLDCKAAETPIEPNLKLKPAEPENVMDKGRYQRSERFEDPKLFSSVVGTLQYITIIRPDLSFAVSKETWKIEGEAEFVWIKNLLLELQIDVPTIPAIYCDNLSIVFFTANPVLHDKTKHF
ncbi:uncharacterized mitochondrial protein AtMg00810-like [Arachis hypogaea]|uniref:uncharacterized mitochondrial protein AtMg00810-like n=1 Tax=Arachis hypogaea TaxID=3818 RepID=UPI003B214976